MGWRGPVGRGLRRCPEHRPVHVLGACDVAAKAYEGRGRRKPCALEDAVHHCPIAVLLRVDVAADFPGPCGSASRSQYRHSAPAGAAPRLGGRGSPAAYAQPHCLCTAPLPTHSPTAYAQPHCLCTAPLPMHSPTAYAQPQHLCTAPLPMHSPNVYAQPHCLCTAPLPMHSPNVYAQPHCLCTAPQHMHSPTAYAQPHCLCTAQLPMHSPTAYAQPHCLCTAPLPMHSPTAYAQPHCLCTTPRLHRLGEFPKAGALWSATYGAPHLHSRPKCHT